MSYLVTASKHEKFENAHGMMMEDVEILESEKVYSADLAEKLAYEYYKKLEGVDHIEIVSLSTEAVCYWHPQEGASATSYNWCEHFDAGGEV